MPSRARAVRSWLYLARASNVASGSAVVTLAPPRIVGISPAMASPSIPKSPVRASARSRWSVDTNPSPIDSMILCACSSTARLSRDRPGAVTDVPVT